MVQPKNRRIATEEYVDTSNAPQNARLNIEESATGELSESAPVTNDGGFSIRDQTGASAFSIEEDGVTAIGSTRMETLPDGSGIGFRIRDKTGAVAFEIKDDGSISLAGGGSAITDVQVIVGAGQSNMSGRGTPAGVEFDPVDSRIFEFGSGASSITPAGVPLDMHDTPTGLSPLTTFAREYARTLPPTTALLLVPAAHGGTGFTTAAPLTWDSTVSGGLYSDMINQTLAAIAAAQDLWGVVPSLGALLWHQGEADGALTTAEYAAHLDALISNARTDLNTPNLPVIVGQMSSDWVAQNAGPLRVQAAHIDTPARVSLTAFADSLPDTGREADLVHFGRTGVEHLGKTMFNALPVARANQDTFLIMPPPNLRAVKAGGVVTAYWDAPLCRATGYTVEYRIGAGAWNAVTGRTIAAQRSQALPADATEVRVATVGPAAISRFTQPAPVQGA